MDGKMLITRGLKMQKFTIGQASADAFWDEPLLVDSFRKIEKDNQAHAFTLFQFLVNERQRTAGLTNVLEAMKGTNSTALINAMYRIYTNAGRRLPGIPTDK